MPCHQCRSHIVDILYFIASKEIPIHELITWLRSLAVHCFLTDLINPTMHLSHIPQYTIQNRNVNISVLNGVLWDMGQMHCVHFSSEWCIVGYRTGALWDLWDWSIALPRLWWTFVIQMVVTSLYFFLVAVPSSWRENHVMYGLMLSHPERRMSFLWKFQKWLKIVHCIVKLLIKLLKIRLMIVKMRKPAQRRLLPSVELTVWSWPWWKGRPGHRSRFVKFYMDRANVVSIIGIFFKCWKLNTMGWEINIHGLY